MSEMNPNEIKRGLKKHLDFISEYYQRQELTLDDTIEPCDETIEQIVNQIREAKFEAAVREIEANIIAISDKLLYSKIHVHSREVPMILGLKCVYTDELPKDVLFAMLEVSNPPLTLAEQNERLELENRELRRKLNRIVEFIE